MAPLRQTLLGIKASDLSSTGGLCPVSPYHTWPRRRAFARAAARLPADARRAPDLHFLCVLLFSSPAGPPALPEQGERRLVLFTGVSGANKVPGRQLALTHACYLESCASLQVTTSLWLRIHGPLSLGGLSSGDPAMPAPEAGTERPLPSGRGLEHPLPQGGASAWGWTWGFRTI